MKKHIFVIGIDEVGRGPIAGPVAVGAFVILRPEEMRRGRLFRGVKESKQLLPAARDEWFDKIKSAQKAGVVDFAVTFQSEKIIDSKGISHAIKKALATSLEKIISKNKNRVTGQPGGKRGPHPTTVRVLLDGGLVAPAHFTNQKTIIRGDAKEQVIALASICAKVLRDRRIVALARQKKYAAYGFDIHKGYGTKAHYAAIKKYGLSSIHRRTFCKNLLFSKKSAQPLRKLAKNPSIG